MSELEAKLQKLLERKAKADALPMSQKLKWAKEIAAINDEIVKIKAALGHIPVPDKASIFDKDKLAEILCETIRAQTPKYKLNIPSDKTGERLEALKRFREKYPIHKEKIQCAGDEVDFAFKTQDADRIIKAIKHLGEMIAEEAEAFNVWVNTDTEWRLLVDGDPEQQTISELFGKGEQDAQNKSAERGDDRSGDT